MPAVDRGHYGGSYRLRARRVRLRAYADRLTRCWRCGLTLAEEQNRQPGKRVRWQAGHTVDGDSSAPLLAEHSTCNASAGATAGNLRRGLNRSEDWY